MTFAHLVELVHLETGLTRVAVTEVLREAFEKIGWAVEDGERFVMPGFGAFVLRTRRARAVVHPISGERLGLAAQRTVGFRASKHLKRRLSK